MTVTVVTPVFNGADHLQKTLRSVTAQTFDDFEYILVDDGSTDGSASIVEEVATGDPRVRLVQQPNAGLSAARNTGASTADPHSEFILFLDDDDLLRPTALEVLVAALRAAPGATAAHGDVAAVDDAGEVVPLVRIEAASRRVVIDTQRWWTPRHATRTLDRDEPSPIDAFGYALFVYTVGQVLMRRERLADVGEFDPIMRVAQDYDLWLRISSRGPIVYVPDVVLDYRQTGDSLSSDQRTTRREDLFARFKCLTDRSLPPATRRLVRNLHRHHEWHRAADRLTYAGVSLRQRDVRSAVRDLVSAGRSAGEALLALTPVAWPYDVRVRRFRQAATR
ncbi:MAG: glycosyltransferase [Ilumatobacter sp.]|uniref:glycosyltransferase n=1 Tax=Ilumatobacter sp. TaxID=1967498 RepID=UPI0032969209